MSFPRTLLLSSGPADFPYAGGEVMRKIIRELPRDTIRWCYLHKSSGKHFEKLPVTAYFPLPEFYWRLRGSIATRIMLRAKARKTALEIARWVKEFKPELLWVLAEEEAVNVGFFLQKELDLPLHLTFHDAPEVFASLFGSYSFLSRFFYYDCVKRLINRMNSLDAVSLELVDHMLSFARCSQKAKTLVFSPSVSSALVDSLAKHACYHKKNGTRRIGFCGSIRASRRQWNKFLCCLGELPFNSELIIFTDKSFFYDVNVPSNVKLFYQKYMATEDELIRNLVKQEIHACYLALWSEEKKRLFSRTSLSSKLPTYAAAGLPIIVDGPEDSVAWKLVNKYSGGVLLQSEKETSRAEEKKALMRLFDNMEEWQKMANGAKTLWFKEFNLDKNLENFKTLLHASADTKNVL